MGRGHTIGLNGEVSVNRPGNSRRGAACRRVAGSAGAIASKYWSAFVVGCHPRESAWAYTSRWNANEDLPLPLREGVGGGAARGSAPRVRSHRRTSDGTGCRPRRCCERNLVPAISRPDFARADSCARLPARNPSPSPLPQGEGELSFCIALRCVNPIARKRGSRASDGLRSPGCPLSRA